MTTRIPKAVLYYSPVSVWSAVALLAIEEKGYGEDEIDSRVVDLGKGENYDPTFLRLHPKGTVPTLVVPYENSLTDDVESRFKALIDIKTIVEFLDKSRTAISRTHSTSNAPAPSLSPATIADTNSCNAIIDNILHAEVANPNTLRYVNARDDAALQVLAAEMIPSLRQRQQTLRGYISQGDSGSIRVSDKVKKLWAEKLDAINVNLGVLENAGKAPAELDEEGKASRIAFFKTARQAWETNLAGVLTQLSIEMVGPYTLGDQYSIADLHLAGWLARVAKLSGGTSSDDGKTIVAKLEGYIGGGFKVPQDFVTQEAAVEGVVAVDKQSKLGAFWDAVRKRPSWQKVYDGGLF